MRLGLGVRHRNRSGTGAIQMWVSAGGSRRVASPTSPGKPGASRKYRYGATSVVYRTLHRHRLPVRSSERSLSGGSPRNGCGQRRCEGGHRVRRLPGWSRTSANDETTTIQPCMRRTVYIRQARRPSEDGEAARTKVGRATRECRPPRIRLACPSHARIVSVLSNAAMHACYDWISQHSDQTGQLLIGGLLCVLVQQIKQACKLCKCRGISVVSAWIL